MVLADHSLQPAVINFLLFSSHIFFSLRDLIVDAEGHIWTVVYADLGAAVGAAADDAEEQQLSVNAVGDVEEEEVGASAKVAMTTTIAQRVQGRQAKGETVVHEQVCGKSDANRDPDGHAEDKENAAADVSALAPSLNCCRW